MEHEHEHPHAHENCGCEEQGKKKKPRAHMHGGDCCQEQGKKKKEHAHEHDGCGCEGGGRISKILIVRLIAGTALLIVGLILGFMKVIEPLPLLALYLPAYLILGGDVVLRAFKNLVRGKVFDENFLMTIATAGAFAIGEFAEAVAVMLFYQAGETVQGLAVGKVRRSITSLIDIRPDYANLISKSDGGTVRVAPESVSEGDIILVRPGEKIPLDGIVESGESTLDTAMLTGEPLPKAVSANDKVLSGCINKSGVLTIRVTAVYAESTASKIIKLTEQASEKKAPTERFISRFAKFYTPLVVLAATVVAVVPPLFVGIGVLGVWSLWLHRALIFLVISCPCALVISIPLGFFGGIGGAARKGILVKGGSVLEALARLGTVMFDKTGTLTKGVFGVTKTEPASGIGADELLEAAAYAEAFSLHPIARCIAAAYGKELDKSQLSGYVETAGKGVRVMRGTDRILAGNARLLQSEQIEFSEPVGEGAKVYVAVNRRYFGCIVISDEVKPDARAAVTALKARGIRMLMLTGDNEAAANSVAREVGIDEVYAELLPHEKAEIAERVIKEKRHGGTVAFVGDGINDAPVLALSDIGIAMGGLGSDAAVEAADVVFMTDEPGKIIEAQHIARRTKAIVWQNIILAFAVKLAFIVLGVFGIATLWEAVFADVGVALLAVLNSLRALGRNRKRIDDKRC